ncbi:MAG: serine/threonine protein kinase [Myxococcales bacterium]|nr:serine/threonine protein kinase [Myxococcales bacterium]
MSSGDAGGGEAVDPRVGQVLGERYRLARRLEARENGARYEARSTVDGRVVDVELLRADATSADVVAQFLETARTVARVGHEGVVQIFNGGRAPWGDVFLAVEPLESEGEGSTLARVLAQEPPLPWDRAQSLLLQLAGALGALHKHGLVHGDLRPESVRLVARDARRELVKLRDVGADRLRGSSGPVVDPRADVQALGRLGYRMVTGASASVEGDVPAPTSQRPAGTLPTELDGVLLRALERDPERRWPDMASFAEALGRCRLTRRQSVRVEALAAAELAGNRAASGAFEAATHRRHRAWSVVSVVAAVVLATLGLRVLKSAPGHVQITTLPPDAEVTFNGMPVPARSPIVLDADPGHYVLVVSRAGFATAARAVDVTARATVDVAVELSPSVSNP